MRMFRNIFPLLILLLISACGTKESEKVLENKKTVQKDSLSLDEFNLPRDSFFVRYGIVKRNQTLSDILYPFGLSYQKIIRIAEASKGKYDVKKIRKGDKYFVYQRKDSTRAVKYFVLQPDLIRYVVFDIDSTVSVRIKHKPVKYKRRTAAGIITSSLFEALAENNLSPKIALRLSEIFAWQIDFYRIRKYDEFKVIYDEKYVDGKPIGVGKIYAAYFKNAGRKYYAFLFEVNGEEDYFDEEGNSLRKAFLKAPIKFGRITSRYSLHRYHPILHRIKAHLGTDYAAPIGTPIMATGDGVVIEARYKRNNGNYVKIRHNSVYTTQYLHMSRFAKGIKPGVKVKQGQIIGYVGMTGLATGPHVCYRFWKNGKQVDHLKEKFPSSKPVPKKFREQFFALRDKLKRELDEIPIGVSD
jgi:murein DD-endopeptidase MepM/ murein hydrolase activator NlpD